MQVFPLPALELFGGALYYSGTAGAFDIDLDSSDLIQQPLGMDYDLFSEVTGDFSALDVNQLSFVFGGNYQLSSGWMLNATGGYNDYGDEHPYLFDTTGRRFYLQLGAGLIF